LEWLQQQSALETLVEQVAAHTRQLARRQETWFRSFSEIRPIAVDEPLDANAIADQIVSWIG
jgi:tRNA dimethylallyltransferase